MSLRIVLILILCLVATVLESVFPFLFGLRLARADLLLSVVLYVALNDEVITGAGLAALAGYLGEIGSASPSGLYTFLAVLTWLVVRLGARGLRSEGGVSSAAVAFGTSLVHSLFAASLFYLVVPAPAEFGWRLGTAVPSALMTGLAAPVVFGLLRRIDALFLPSAAEGPTPRGMR